MEGGAEIEVAVAEVTLAGLQYPLALLGHHLSGVLGQEGTEALVLEGLGQALCPSAQRPPGSSGPPW